MTSAQAPSVSGRTVDDTGRPLPGVVITVRGTTTIAVSADDGRFTIAPAPQGSRLVFEMPGFAMREVAITTTESLQIVLSVANVTSNLTVRAPAVSAPPDTRIVLRPIDIVRTAGAEADLMRAVAATPGIVRVDEGAGLFVRGGDVSETRVMLNGIAINHPYRHETPTGGFRGAVDPFLTQGVSFSTGGFSAEYPNALSGVLDLQLQERPAALQATATAGLAGAAASAAVPLGSQAGFRLGINKTTTGLLFAVNDAPREFDELPHGWDGSGSVHVDSRRFGSIRGFVLEQRDGVGVRLEQDSFDGFLHSSTSHRLVVVDWRTQIGGRWTASAAGGLDRYTNGTDVGVLVVDVTDTDHSARFDLAGLAHDFRIRAGVDAGRSSAQLLGTVPTRGGDFGGTSGTSLFEVVHRDERAGGYVETSRDVGRITPTVGVRVDRFDNAGVWRVDPRLNLSIKVARNSSIRLAWGRYSQAPSSRYFDQARGDTSLQPMSATHAIVGFEQGRITDAWFVRAEAYYKAYRRLPVDDGAGGFSDQGYGYARGIDVFARRVWRFIDVRASVSYLDTRRRWTSPEQRARYVLPDGTWTPDFSVPLSWQIFVTAPVWRTVSISAAWRHADGRPFTPATGAVPTPAGFEPIWGGINSERVPAYRRADLSVSHTRTFGRTMLVVFGAIDNLTGRTNFFEYAYSPDFSVRRPVASASPRSLYIGCSIIR